MWPTRLRLPPPSAATISRMDAALPWLLWLAPLDAKIVWRRASGERWKSILPLRPDEESKLLRAGGYHTVHLGKWHLGGAPGMRPAALTAK